MNLPKEGKIVLQGSCFMKESVGHSVGDRGKHLMDFAITMQNRSSNFLLRGKVCQILLPVV